jgi:ssDNA-binding replication factor A large subunit
MQREYRKHGFFSFSIGRNRELQCMKPGESEISAVGRLLEVSRREIRTNEGDKRAILHGIIADETAKLPFVSEVEERGALLKDAVVQIENATIKKWKGLPTLYIRKDTTVHIIEDDTEFPGCAALTKPKRKTIRDTVKCEGAFDIIVEGNIVSIVEEQDKRTMVLDDGTGAVFLQIRDKEKAARISFGMQVKVRGNVVESENGYVLIADEVRLSGEAVVLNEMKHFLCKYT